MEQGKNVSPQWAPDGKSIAFVSDRNGVSNIFLYDLGENAGLPADRFLHRQRRASRRCLRCSRGRAQADRLAFVYFEQGKYDVYTSTNPRALKQQALSGSRSPDSSRHAGRRGDTAARHHAHAAGARRRSGLRSAKAARSTGRRAASVRPAR